MKLHLKLLYLFTCLMTSFSITDANELRFKQITIENGLSQSRVSSIVQDSKGFIWVGTEDGLNCYDGYGFEIFTFDPNDSNAISNQVIQSLAADDSGNVWVGTSFGGLNKYISENGRFINYRHDPENLNSIASDRVNSIFRDNKGNLWLGTAPNGFDYFDIKTGTFTHHRHNPEDPNSLISDDNINFVFQDSRGTVWIGTTVGLDRYYPGTKTFRHYTYSKHNPNGISSNDVHSVYEGRQGVLWFGTHGAGLNRFDPQNEAFSSYLLNENNPADPSNRISAIMEDRSGLLWVGTWGGGLYQIEKLSRGSNRYRHSPEDRTSISQDFISVLYEDITGEIWIGTDLNGMNKVDRSATKFKTVSAMRGKKNSLSHNQVRAFWEDDGGVLWLGTAGGGLERYDRRMGTFKNYRHIPGDPNSLSHNAVRAIYQDLSGILWLGTGRGINRFDPKKEKFTHILVNPDNPDDPNNFINYRILELSHLPGILWFGSNGGGLCKYDKNTKKLYHLRQETTNADKNQINFIRSLYQSKSNPNILWVGTLYGFFSFDIQTETFKNYSNDPKDPESLSSNNVMGFYEDGSKNLWIATYGGGLNYFNPETEEFRVYTTQNSSSPSNSVYGLLADNNGYLWLSSNRGISKFDRRLGTFKNFTVEDGLQSDEFNGGAYYQSNSGEMLFGGIGGFNAFYPESITDNPHKPQIVLTDFKLFNKSVNIGPEEPLQKYISETDQITLHHWQNDISLEFVALHYYRSTNNTYAYMLENYDDYWRYVDDVRSAVYTNLDPGEYIFKVKAANSDGVWNEDGPVLPITILPPWWSTTWAYFGYGLIFIFGVFIVDRMQRYRLTLRERNQAMIREAELRAKAAEEENARKTNEMEEARRLQLSLLPDKLPDLANLEIAVYMKTATEVGGDYYDYNLSADGTLNIALGDATGHGMRAGTVVTLMKGLFSADSGGLDIPAFFRQSSETIKDLRFDRMMMSFTLIKIKGTQMLLSFAGMPPAYIFRNSTLKIEEISLDGMPLGAMKDYNYQVKKDILDTGDTLLLMSDGLPELKNPDDQIFDYPRVQAVFKDVADQPPQMIIDRLVDAGEIWRKDRLADDDITLMVIKSRHEV
jgi:ligand-binding sensor domain-containing protein/serine phosphatase RsbU (regulator of sigma subunit)